MGHITDYKNKLKSKLSLLNELKYNVDKTDKEISGIIHAKVQRVIPVPEYLSSNSHNSISLVILKYDSYFLIFLNKGCNFIGEGSDPVTALDNLIFQLDDDCNLQNELGCNFLYHKDLAIWLRSAISKFHGNNIDLMFK